MALHIYVDHQNARFGIYCTDELDLDMSNIRQHSGVPQLRTPVGR